MSLAKSVVGLGLWLVYGHDSRWKLLNRYMLHSRSWYLTMLMLPAGWNLRRMLQKSPALTKPFSSNYSSKVNFKRRPLSSVWLNLACTRKVHKCISVFDCLNNLVSKYLIQYFTRNKAFDDRITRSVNLHPPKPKHNMERRTVKYVGTIHFNSFRPALKVSRPGVILKVW